MLTRITQTMHQPALSTFLISWLLLVMESNPKPIFDSCSGDMIFVMDASSSIWIVDFRRQLEFVANLVDTFNIGPGPKQVSISAITFSDHAHLDFPLNRFQSREELKKTILEIPYRMGGTNTAEALKLLGSIVSPYASLKKRPLIAVVITDGLSWDSEKTKKEAEAVHRLGINVHAIGVGDRYDMEELKTIASDPIHGVHEVTSYSALNTIADKFRVRLCEVTIPTTRKPTILSTEQLTKISNTSPVTATRKGMAENNPQEVSIGTPRTTEATNLMTSNNKLANKTGETMTSSNQPKAGKKENASQLQENTATVGPSMATSSTRKQMSENAPTSSTQEILNIFTTTEAATLETVNEEIPNKTRMTTTATPTKSELRENESEYPKNFTVGNASDIPQRDHTSTVIFGFDLESMGQTRTKSILQFINYLLPHIEYGKFALISNPQCLKNYNIPLKSARNEDVTLLLHSLNEKEHRGLVDIIRHMNKELFKEAYYTHEERPKRLIGVLFVDPSVSEITSEVLLEAEQLKKNGIELFVISIGTVWADVDLFYELSSQPHQDFIFYVPTYKDLVELGKRLPIGFR